VINLDKLTYAGNLENLKSVENNPNYTFIQGDIGNKELVDKIMDDIDIVVHFAAESHVDRSIKNPELFLETNIIGTQVLLESALKNNIKRFHHISTDEVFGALALNTEEKFSHNTAYNPHSPYSASKAASDHLVRAYGTTYGLPYTITNCSNNYGEYQFPEKFIPLTITNLVEGKNIPVYGDGLYVRDWLYVQDHCTAIDRVLTDGKLSETYLVGGLTKDVSNLEISKMIIEKMSASEDMIEYVKDRPGHDRRYAVDWTKINKELGWEPSVSLEEGIQKTIDWYLENKNWWQKLKDTNEKYFTEQYKK
jgi:dTDP-glucose 4,6-dehydratase